MTRLSEIAEFATAQVHADMPEDLILRGIDERWPDATTDEIADAILAAMTAKESEAAEYEAGARHLEAIAAMHGLPPLT